MDKVFKLFEQMQEDGVNPNQITWTTLETACAAAKQLEKGKQVHQALLKSGTPLHIETLNSLVAMYTKCGSLIDARKLFHDIPISERNLVTGNTMISVYGQGGIEEAHGVRPNVVTWTAKI